MDEPVQDNGQINVTVVVDVRVKPVEEEDGGVMVHVQKTKLAPLFAQHNEDGIPKVPNFGNVKQPKQIGHGWVLRVVVVAGFQYGVIVAVGQHHAFDGHVSAQHDLRHVVKEFDGIRVHGGNSELHNGAAQKHKRQVGQSHVEGGGEVRQWPSLWGDDEQ